MRFVLEDIKAEKYVEKEVVEFYANTFEELPSTLGDTLRCVHWIHFQNNRKIRLDYIGDKILCIAKNELG